MLLCTEISKIEEIENFFRENKKSHSDCVVKVDLPYGRILEIVHEKNGLPEEEHHFSWQINCSNEEFASGIFEDSLGIIDMHHTGTFSQETYREMIRRAMLLGEKISPEEMPETISETNSPGNESLMGMETLSARDEKLERLWKQLGDIPRDPDTECIEEPFISWEDNAVLWEAGTPVEQIWKWFDERHSKGVAYLMYGDGEDRTYETANLLYLNALCQECESASCQFNHSGECRFSLVHERKPRITEDDGCIDFEYREGENRNFKKEEHYAKENNYQRLL